MGSSQSYPGYVISPPPQTYKSQQSYLQPPLLPNKPVMSHENKYKLELLEYEKNRCDYSPHYEYCKQNPSGCKIVDKKKLYGFDNGKEHKFVLFVFKNIQVFNKVRNLSRSACGIFN